MNRQWVVVSGLPASGKSTLARALSPRLALPLLDKDDILEALFDSLGVEGTDERRRLSRASDTVLRRLCETSPSAVVTSFWRHPNGPAGSGTPVDWLSGSAGSVVEVFCHCPPAVAAGRFTDRRRHAGHGDVGKAPGEVLEQFETLAALGPLGIGPLLRVDTSGEVDADQVAASVARLLPDSLAATGAR